MPMLEAANQLVIRDMTLRDIGQVLSESGFFEDAKDAAKAIVKVLAGQELGVGPITSMTGIHIIKGKPSLSANLMAATVKRSGKYDYRIRELTPQNCRIEFFQKNGWESTATWESVGESTFSFRDARQAGTQNLEKFPRNMLFARAISNGAKWYCPDVFGAPVYTPEELGGETETAVDGEMVGEVVEKRPGAVGPLSPELAGIDATPLPVDIPLCTPQQQADIKRMAAGIGMTREQLVAAIQRRGKTRLAELNQHQATEIFQAMSSKSMGQQNNQTFRSDDIPF